MIKITDLTLAINKIGSEGSSLMSLANTPSSRAAIGILAERTSIEIDSVHCAKLVELYTCYDRSLHGIQLHNPFAIICIDNGSLTSRADVQFIVEDILYLLRERDLHKNPIIVLLACESEAIKSLLWGSRPTFIVLTAKDLVAILVARPPRIQLIRKVRESTPLTLLNPYIYKGPIDRNMFYGRQDQLKKLCELRASYTMVGPRTIGKTSLIKRAHEDLREQGHVVIRAEMRPGMSESELVYHIIDRFVTEVGAPQVLLTRCSVKALERLIENYAVRYTRRTLGAGWIPHPRKKVAIFIDEADELMTRFPTLSASFRHCHDQGWAKFVFAGYKDLRKAINDAQHSTLLNVAQEFPISAFSPRETAALVMEPMVELGIELESHEKIVEIIHRESGGCPSRIQMLCHFIIESLDNSKERVIGPVHAQRAIRHPAVRKIIINWFRQSTSPIERWIAALASYNTPCSEEALVSIARNDIPSISGHSIRGEIQDLITANVIDYREDGLVDFTFPAMRDMARPSEDDEREMAELRNSARELFYHD